MRIAIASDTASTSELEAALGNHGVLCDAAESIAELPSVVALSGPYDLVLLRVGQPAAQCASRHPRPAPPRHDPAGHRLLRRPGGARGGGSGAACRRR